MPSGLTISREIGRTLLFLQWRSLVWLSEYKEKGRLETIKLILNMWYRSGKASQNKEVDGWTI